MSIAYARAFVNIFISIFVLHLCLFAEYAGRAKRVIFCRRIDFWCVRVDKALR